MPRRFQKFSNASEKKTADDSIDTFVYYLGNGFGMPRHFAKGYDLVFKQFRLLFLPNYIVYVWNTWMGETEDTIFLPDHWFWFWFWFWFWPTSEVVVRRCSIKKVLLEILQNSQENTRASVSFLITLRAYISVYITQCVSWRSEGHFKPPGGAGKMHISTSKKH